MKIDTPILELIDRFLSEKDIRTNSRSNYLSTLRTFINWMVRNKINVRTPTRADIILYKGWLREQKRSANTIDSYLSSVRQFFRWLEGNGIYQDVASGVHSPKKYRGFRKGYLKQQEVEHLINSIEINRVIGKRDKAILSLMVTMGLRAVEISRLDVDDIKDDGEGMVLHVWGKGREEKDRVIGYIPDYVMSLISEYLLARDAAPGDSPLFISARKGRTGGRMATPTISRMVATRLRMVNLKTKDITCHSLRHTAGITALKNGADIHDVKALLGHTSVETTMIYLSAIEQEKAANNRAVQALTNAFKIEVKTGV